MDTLRDLENKLNNILNENANVVELGSRHIGRLINELDGIKNKAYDVSTDVFTSLSRDENGRMVGRDGVEYEISELAALTSKVDSLTDRIYDEIHKLSVEKDRKREMISQRFNRMRDINNNIRLYQSELDKLRLEVTEYDRMIALYENDETMKNIYEQKKAINEKGIIEFTAIINSSSVEAAKMRNEASILMNGGILEEEKEEELTSLVEPMEETEERLEAIPAMPSEEEKEDEDKVGFIPLVGTADFAMDSKGGETAEPLPMAPSESLDDLPEASLEEGEELEGLPEAPLEEGEELEDLPEAPSEELEEVIGEPVEEEDKDAIIAPIPVTEVSQPKPTLFQKVKDVMYKAILVLGGLSATTLAIDHFLNHHDIATMEENPNEEDKNEDENKYNNGTTNNGENYNPGENNNPGGYHNPGGNGVDVSDQEDDKDNDKDKEDEKPSIDPIVNDNTQFPIELGTGETAYNYETGVEVTKDGTAVKYNEEGESINQKDRDLEQTDHNTSVVLEDDLYPDLNSPEMTFEEQLEAVPSTGSEKDITREETIASGELTQGEQENLDNAFDALENFFNEEYTLVP